ncbi:MAG: pyrrolo-quinoline quinone [Rhodopirellula sp.]|nr:pyrrolo-quinoline quinone [Rhodopirellula sp.]
MNARPRLPLKFASKTMNLNSLPIFYQKQKRTRSNRPAMNTLSAFTSAISARTQQQRLFMPNTAILTFTACLTWCVLANVAAAADPANGLGNKSWLGFRGDGTSHASSSAPEKLEIGDDGNLAWKLKMPGRSVAGPIVIGDLVVTTSSSGQDGEVLHISGVNLQSGKLEWEQTFRATGRPFCHPTSANAAPSPVSDGQRIFAFFSSNDLACLSLSGELLWYRGLGYDYPKAGNDVGMASSPVVVDGTVIVKVEAQGDSFAAAIDAETGENLWRLTRPQASNWASPLVIRRPDDRNEVVIQSRQGVIAVDPRSGKTQWSADEGGSAIPSPTSAEGLLILPSDEVVALKVGASASAPEVAWRNNKLSPRNASLVASDKRLYSLKGSVLVAANLQDGEQIWQKRLRGLGSAWATPVLSENRLYIFDQTGKGLIVEDQGDDAETTHEIELGEGVLGSPAIANGRLVIRAANTLFCFQ